MELETIEIEGEKFVPAVALAAAHGVPRETVYMAVRSERLPGIQKLGRLLIPLAAAQAFEVQQRGGARQGAGRKKKAQE